VTANGGTLFDQEVLLSAGTLTEEEIQEYAIQQSPTPDSASAVVEVYDSQTQTTQYSNQDGDTLVAVQISDEELLGVNKPTTVTQTAYVVPGSDVYVVSASTNSVSGNLTTITVAGTIFKTDPEGHYFYLDAHDWDGPVLVRLSPSTTVLINNQPMSPTNLRVADVVRVQGLGTKNHPEVSAETIELTGTVEIGL
jgi:hypothetical protein